VLSPTPTSYAWQAIDYVLTQSWALAEEKSTALDARIDETIGAIDGYLGDIDMVPAEVTTDVAVAEPNVLIPEEAAGIDTTFYDAMVTDAIDKLSNLFNTYIDVYFPVNDTTLSYTETWLQTALTTGGTGIDQTLEEQFYENDRSRILRDTARQVDEATNMFAAKRFPIPPGFLNGTITRIQNASLQELSKSSREVALKQAQIEIENVRFAVEQGIKLRQIATTTAGDYIKALASSITVAQNLAVTQADAQNGLINAAANFYRARIEAKDLLLKRDKTNSDYEQEEERVEYEGDIRMIMGKVEALVAAANAVAHQAAAALNNLHANVSGSQQNQESGSVNYNYAGDVSGDPSPRTWP
jgi:hypothetical protein